jgi:thioredoxin 1
MSGPNVLDINDLNFESEVLASKEPFLLELSAIWCGPCKVLEPILDRLADERIGQLRVGKLDVEDTPLVASRFQIRGLPTVLVFRDGREVARHLGVTNRERLLSLVFDQPTT